MKANAPEKIYLHPTAKGKVGASWLAFPLTNEDIEYVRTDAFIDKVSDWLKDCATITYMNGEKHIDKEMYKATFEDFKNFMKGEKV